MELFIREEQANDITAIRKVNQAAFAGPREADLVDRLRGSCSEFLSLVALDGPRLVGHILFTPVILETADGPLQGMGLAPMAVLPGYQRRGIGSMLVRDGIKRLQNRNWPFVIVLGHPEYYPRFGFEPASRHGLRSQWEGIPDEAFMILLLDPSIGNDIAGTARFREEFTDANEPTR